MIHKTYLLSQEVVLIMFNCLDKYTFTITNQIKLSWNDLKYNSSLS